MASPITRFKNLRKSVRTKLIALFATLVAAVLVISGTVAVRTALAEPVAANVVRVGVDSDSFDDIWDAVNQELKARGQDVSVQLVKLDGSLINKSLANGEIDLNAAPHYAYFDYQVKQEHYDLEPFAETFIQPLNVYSNSITSLDQLKDGDLIAVPNDVTNQGRALKVLESAGLITTDPAKGYLPGVADITSNPKHLQIIGTVAYQIPQQLPDVAAGIINAEIALDAGLDPVKDAIYAVPVHPDDIYNHPWINLIAGRKGEGGNPNYRKVIEAYDSDRVRQVIHKDHASDTVLVFKDLKAA